MVVKQAVTQMSAPASVQARARSLKGFSGLAALIYIVMIIIAVGAAIFLDSAGVSDGWIAVEVVGLFLVIQGLQDIDTQAVERIDQGDSFS